MTIQCYKDSGILKWDINCNFIIPLFYNYGIVDNINFLHGGDIYNYKRNLIDFSSNINPLGLGEKQRNVVLKNFDKVSCYPDTEARKLKKCLAKFWKIKEENILVGNGSVELIYLVVQSLKPKKVLIPSPAFSEYERAVKISEGKIEFLNLEEGNDFTLNINLSNFVDILFLANPNNPTGNFVIENKSEIKNLKCKFVAILEI